MNVLDTVQLLDDVFNLGLRATTSTDRQPELADRIVEVRKAFRSRLELDDLGDLVVPFESGGYNLEATVIENLLFGAASGPSLSDGALAENRYVQSLLTASGLEEPLYKMGIEIASNVVELFRDLPSNHPFFQQLILMTAEEIPNFQALLGKLQNRSMEEASREERAKFITLSFAYVEPRQRFDVLDQGLMTRIVDAREAFAENLPPELKGRIERYDLEQFNTAASIMDNVLLGRISHQYADAAEKIRAIVRSVINDLGLQRNLISIGLEFDAGVGGKRLTVGQRQKLNLARALLKRPDFLILNRSLSALDQQTQGRILVNILDGVKAASSRPTIICVLANPRHADLFDRVIIFDRGILVADGTYQALLTNNDVFKGLIS
jgi:putative ABC transport system ATP-binding protein